MIPSNGNELRKMLFDQQRKYVMEEKAKIEIEAEISEYLLSSRDITNAFSSIKISLDKRREEIMMLISNFKKLSDAESFTSDVYIQEAQKKGILQVILVPFWDKDMVHCVDSHLETVLHTLNASISSGALKRPLHIVVFVPRCSREDIIDFANQWALYVALRKYLDYLIRKELEIMDELDKTEKDVMERKGILSFSKKRKLRRLHQLREELKKTFQEEKDRIWDQLSTLCKEITARIVAVYSVVIYYHLDAKQFVSSEIHDLGEILEKINNQDSIDFADYVPIINEYFNLAVGRIGFETNASKLIDTFLQPYYDHFALGLRSAEFDVYYVIENFMRGSYGVRPLSLNVVRRALKMLNNRVFSKDSIRIRAVLDVTAGILRLMGERPIRETEEISKEEQFTEELKETKRISVKLPAEVTVGDIVFRIEDIIRKANPNSISICAKVENMRLKIELENPKLDSLGHLSDLVNPLISLSRGAKANIEIEFEISEDVPYENGESILKEHPLEKRTTFDDFLPP